MRKDSVSSDLHDPTRRRFLGAGLSLAAVTATKGAVAFSESVALASPAYLRLARGTDADRTELLAVESFGAKGDGWAADDEAFGRAVAYMAENRRPVRLTGGKRYVLNRRLAIPDAGGLVGSGGATIFVPAASFNNRDLSVAGRYGDNAVVLDLSGSKRDPSQPRDTPVLRGFRIESERKTNRCVNAVVARNVRNLVIDALDISGFPLGCGIKAASLTGKNRISRNRIHDFYDDSVWPALPQITGIEVDNDTVAGVSSSGIVIAENTILNMTVSPEFFKAHGYQTDGINLLHVSDYVIRKNHVSNVGEGLDIFGITGQITDNTVTDSYLFGIKLIHGASDNNVIDNIVLRSGIAGIVIVGSSRGQANTARNTISRNTVKDVNALRTYDGSDTACIRTGNGSEGGGVATDNIIENNVLDPGDNGKYAYVRGGSGYNDWIDNKIVRPGLKQISANPLRETGTDTFEMVRTP
jgi:parallel beta-helix repeat protein